MDDNSRQQFDTAFGGEADPNLADDAAAQVAQVIPADASNSVSLPPDAVIGQVTSEGRDLVIVLEDGSRIVIPDGAIVLPQLLVGDTAIPPANLAALLVGNEPEPAAGETQSSGGNFATDPGDIQSAFDIGDLLPYTELSRPEEEEEEIIPALPDEDPVIDIEIDDSGVSVINAEDSVDEAGLPDRGSEPPGTGEIADGDAGNDSDQSEQTFGFINFDSPDGVDNISINGVEITTVGQTFTSDLGVLTITSIEAGRIGYDYVLSDNTTDPTGADNFSVTITDTDGDVATATLRIDIVDDGPIGADDEGTVPSGTHDPITGNVLDNDTPGADDFAVEGGVTGFSNSETSTAQGSAEPGESLQGDYGVLTLNTDGSYTYVRDFNTPGGVEESFDYTIVDQDGSTSGATLTITIENALDEITFVPDVGEGTEVDEGGLPPRDDEPAGTGEISDGDADNDSDQSETTGATITFNSPDGVDSVSIGGTVIDPGNLPQVVVDDETGTLVVTDYTYDPETGDGSITYEYTLGDNTDGDDTSVTFDIVVRDLDGDEAADELVIDIVDDEPIAVDDLAVSVAEDAVGTVGGNVVDNDTPGADDATVTSVNIGGTDYAVAQTGTTIVATANGTYTFTSEGDWTFDPNTNLDQSAGDVDATFTYTLTDGDTDFDTAIQPISITDGADPEAGEPISLTVDDENLSDGTDPAVPVTDDGSITFTAGSDAIVSIAFDDGANALDNLGGGLTWVRVSDTQITGSDGGTLVVTLDLSVSGTTATVTATLSNNYDSHPTFTADDLQALGSVDVVATDTDGDTASASVSVSVSDDVPTLTATDPETELLVDESVLATDDTQSFAAAFAVNDGADGTKSLTYALSVVDGTDSGLVDTATDEAVLLFDNGGVIEGRTSGTGDVVFALTVDGSGNVTLDQQRAIVHPLSPDNHDEPVSLGNELITLTATVTDGDDDVASDSIDLGGNITFEDDGPSVTIELEADAVVRLDESGDGAGASGLNLGSYTAGDDPDVAGSNALSIASSGAAIVNMATDNPVYGADGQGADPVYALQVDATASLTNLTLTDGSTITLVKEGAVIVGVVDNGAFAGQAAFAIGIDADTGVVTVEQYLSLTHPISPDNYDEPVSMDAGAISVVVTVEDGDEDTADSNAIDISGNISFEDDGFVASDVTAPDVLDDEAQGSGNTAAVTGDVSPDVLTTSGSAGDLFTAGADGVKSVSISGPVMSVIVIDGDGVASTEAVVWNAVVDNGDGSWTLSGDSASVPDAAVLTVYADGSYDYTQGAPVVNGTPGTSEETTDFVFSVTVTDGDDDTASSDLTIQVNDDTPVASDVTAPDVLDDEAQGSGNTAAVTGDVSPDVLTTSGSAGDLFTAGADGVKSVSISGPVMSVIVIDGDGVASTEAVVWNAVVDNGDGSWTLSGDSASVPDAAVLTVYADGSYDYTQGAPVVNGTPGTSEETTDFVFSVTVTDGDDDTASSDLTIQVNDDTPVASDDSFNQVSENAVVNGDVSTNDSPGADGIKNFAYNNDHDGTGILSFNADGTFSYTPGAGEEGTVTFSYTLTDGDDDPVIGNVTINLVGDSTPTVSVTDGTVDEQGLPAGTGELADDNAANNSDTSETTTGTFSYDTFNDNLGALEVQDKDGNWIDVTAATVGTPITVTGDYGTLSVTSDGAGNYSWSYTLTTNLDHPDTDPDDGDGIEGADDEIPGDSFAVRVSDDDGDTSATDSLDITVRDDAPLPVTADASSMANTLGAVGAFDLDSDDDVDDNLGADGRGGVIFYSDNGGANTLTDDTIDILEGQNLTSGLAPLEYEIINGGKTLVATKSTDDSEVFRIDLEPVGNEDQYVVTVSEKVDATTDVDFNDGGYNFVGGNTSWAGFTQPGDNDSQDLLLTPVNGGSVNTNANEGGIDNNNVGGTEAMRVDYVIDLVGSPVNGGDFYGGDDTQSFDGHYTVNGGSAYFTQITSSTTVTIAAFDDDDSGTLKDVGDGTPDTITGIAISYNGVTSQQITIGGTYEVGGNNFTVTFNVDGTAEVSGVPADTRIAAYTNDGYNSIEWGHGGGNTFKIGDFGASIITDDPVSFNVPIYVIDGDDDMVASGNLDITLNPVEPIVALDLDGDGVEFLGTDAGIMYDLNGDTVAESVAWVGPDDGFLVYDLNSNGSVDSAAEIVFENGSKDAFDYLAAFDTAGIAGALDAADGIWGQLGVWQDLDSDGVFDGGEFFTMSDLGITYIEIVDDDVSASPANGEVVLHGSAEFNADGTGTLASGTYAVANALLDPSTEENRQAQTVQSTALAAGIAGFIAEPTLYEFDDDAVLSGERSETQSDVGEMSTISLSSEESGDGETDDVSLLDTQDQTSDGETDTADAGSTPSEELDTQISDTQALDADQPVDQSDGLTEDAGDAVFASADGASSTSALMEALLAMSSEDGTTETSSTDEGQVDSVLEDALAESTVDSVIEASAESSDGATSGADDQADHGVLAALLDSNLGGDSSHVAQIQVDDTLDQASMTAEAHA